MYEADPQVAAYRFAELAPAGHYLAIRVGFAFPEYEHNALPLAWVHTYVRSGLMVHDPVMHWIYANNGVTRWSEIKGCDRLGVLVQAAAHGLRYGAAVCISGAKADGTRSFGTFCRSDREFTEEELHDIRTRFSALHADFSPPEDITDAEIAVLQHVKKGHLIKEVAYELRISEGAVKQRLRNAKTKLSARTTAHAVSKAAGFGLI